MKWLFIFILLANLFYLAWEIQRETRIHIQEQAGQAPVPTGTPELTLLAELAQKPDSRSNRPITETDLDLQSAITTTEPAVAGPASSGDAPAGDFYTAMPEPVNIDNDTLLMEMVRGSTAVRNDFTGTSVACFSYGPFSSEADFASLRDWFEQRRQTTRQRVEYEQDRELFWVYLAPTSDDKTAVARLSELKQKGVEDYRLIRKGSFKNAISLGLFSSQAGVNRRLSELNARGYQPVVVPYHDSEAMRIYWLDVVLAENKALASEIFSGFPARFNSLPKDCDEIAMIGNNP